MTEVPSAYRVVPTLVGAYDWDLVTDVWTWSPELFVMHGLPARGTEVTTELLLRHKHPDDVEYVSAAITWARRTGLPFSCLHRVVRADGAERVVVASGQRFQVTAAATCWPRVAVLRTAAALAGSDRLPSAGVHR